MPRRYNRMPPILSLFVLHVSIASLLLLSGMHFQTTAADSLQPAQNSQEQLEQLKQQPSHQERSDGECTTHDLPNPLIELYPNDVTGVLNVTLAIVPIPLETARRIVPDEYPILEEVYRAMLPDFPEGMYPVLVQAGHDHDIHLQGYSVADFSRAGYEFPFIDLLNDGKTTFRWAPEQIIEVTNEIAVQGSRMYGTTVHPATFDPPCDAYGRRPSGATYFNGTSTSNDKYMAMEFLPFSPTAEEPRFPYPMSFFHHVVNQPIFADGQSPCDLMVRLFNTTLTAGSEEEGRGIRRVVGGVWSNMGPFEEETRFDAGTVFGVHVATAFIENNLLECESLRGYDEMGVESVEACEAIEEL